jgi:hypothetical protein
VGKQASDQVGQPKRLAPTLQVVFLIDAGKYAFSHVQNSMFLYICFFVLVKLCMFLNPLDEELLDQIREVLAGFQIFKQSGCRPFGAFA